MNFDIFDEDYYLKKYPYLQPAIEQGIIQSGLDHFQRFGLQLGLTGVSRYYDEAYYLEKNPDVAEAVNSGIFPSGLAHFIEIGYEEGRADISSDYHDFFYRQTNRDILPFIRVDTSESNGLFHNALEHFLKFGAEEGRYSNSFFEAEYLKQYPNIIPAIESGVLRTGRDHYEQFGQFEEGRKATFIGTSSIDILESFGTGEVELIGLPVRLDNNERTYFKYSAYFIQDTLIGSSASDTFVIGVDNSLFSGIIFPRDVSPNDFYYTHSTYGGKAVIKNYDPNNDFIKLGHVSPDYYRFDTDQISRVNILSNKGGILATVEGITDIEDLNIIYGNKKVAERNFFEDYYLLKNPDVKALVEAGNYRSGLDHYEQVGQFDASRSATFIGTPGNDIVAAFGIGSHRITGVETRTNIGAIYYTREGVKYMSDGRDEFDTLIGSSGADTFVFGDILLSYNGGYTVAQQSYLGEGEAFIQGFNQAEGDQIEIVTFGNETYSIFPSGDDLIVAIDGDTIAVLDGGADITLRPVSILDDNFSNQTITLG
ncbi:hypothetical protein [Lyngbya sp. PCC 8106]|uniref:hypothetical protein n=1 Tax=Lyngbya sp. (strain PCC 8106) TaxID=313612 RepID=UPI0000EAB2BE|nr:hypothetical protein [Lyngbya sp. PCC 8106]EAW33580.1 Hemolysin-type calcium-binding region protein [Lyngbya sp. PCC 8106]